MSLISGENLFPMANSKYIKWLYEQLPGWVAQGIINQEQANQLRTRYGEIDDQPDYNLAFIIIGILGALLVGGGIILIVAYNWEDFSKTTRTVLSFAPLIVAQIIFGFAYFKRRNSIAWAEGASTFLMLMLAASIALVSQTYHIWGEPETFLWSWLVLSIPLIYLSNSSLVTIIYLIGIASWTMQVNGSDSVWYWLLLAAAVPHLILNMRTHSEFIRRNILGWALVLTFIFGWFGTIEASIPEFGLVGTALTFSMFYLLGDSIKIGGKIFITRPFRAFAVSGSFVLLLFLTYEADFQAFDWAKLFNGSFYLPWAGHVNFIILIFFSICFLWLLSRKILTQSWSERFATFLPLFTLLILIISRQSSDFQAMVMANIYLLAWGILYLVEGIQARHMGLINLGMLFILVLATARFFDTEWDFIVKGIAFIVLGLGFLAANWLLSKRIKLKSS